MKSISTTPQKHCSGFTLTEVMVGMIIGMLGIIVMMQMFSLSEERKRSTTGGSDAQSNAMIAMDSMQRDIGQSGQGFTNMTLLNCSLLLPTAATITLAPVQINHAAIPSGDPNSSTLLVSYGNANDQPDGYAIQEIAGSAYTVSENSLFNVNDKLVVSPKTCAGVTLSVGNVISKAANKLTLSTSTSGISLFNLGSNPSFRGYRVNNGNLESCDFMASKCQADNQWQNIASGVVSLQVFYGRDSNSDGIVDIFDRATPTTACGWIRTPAIRIAVVARNAQFDRTEDQNRGVVTTALPRLSDGTEVDVRKNPDGSDNPVWGNYRYQVYETVIPIRTIAWIGADSGC